jgi:phage baseplate assembly protein V
MMVRGLVAEVDAGSAAVRVQYPEFSMTSGWLPVLVPLALGAKAFALPRPGSQVVVLADEDLDDAVVVGCIYSRADPAPAAAAKMVHVETEDGTRVTIDPDTRTVTVDTPGNLIANTGGDIQAQAGGSLDATAGTVATIKAPEIVLDGVVSVTHTLAVAQSIMANGGITTTSGGPVPGNLTIQGEVHSETKVISPAATIAGRDFMNHTHPTSAPGSDTGPVT